MMNRFFILCAVLVFSASVLAGLAVAEVQEQTPGITEDGLIYVPAFNLPMSPYISEEAREYVAGEYASCLLGGDADPEKAVRAWRKCYEDTKLKPLLAMTKLRYLVTIQQKSLGGVNTYTVEPAQGIASENENKVLIFLPGSAYQLDTKIPAQLTAVPIASVGKIKVVGVNYRTWPEAQHPAASEDVVAVYREILKSYKPENIGVYGCSAGALLASQIPPLFDKLGLPLPAAIAMDGFAGSGDVPGDAFYITLPLLSGTPYFVPAGANPRTHRHLQLNPYFQGVDTKDPMIVPVLSADVLRNFPPSLLTTATRDYGLSSVVHTHSQLIKQGVEADLHVWEGLTHCFMTNSNLPESRDAYNVVWKFFDKHLGK